MDVRVDSGPQDGTILVTWIPVTLNITTPGQKVPSTQIILIYHHHHHNYHHHCYHYHHHHHHNHHHHHGKGKDGPDHGIRSVCRREKGDRRGFAIK